MSQQRPPAGTAIDPDRLKNFIKTKKAGPSEIEVAIDGGSPEMDSDDPFSSLPEFITPAPVPPQKPGPNAWNANPGRVAIIKEPSAGLLTDKQFSELRMIGIAALSLLTLLLVFEISKAIISAVY